MLRRPGCAIVLLYRIDVLDCAIRAALDHHTVATRAVIVGDEPAPDHAPV